MLLSEFEQLTGFHPTANLYAAIEAAYYDFDGDKKAFCAAYKANKDGLAKAIQCEADYKAFSAQKESERAARKAAAESKERIEALEREVERLKAQLEQEMEWCIYEDRDDISQADYDELRASGRPMTDEEAIDWVEQETGFARHRISIVREAPALEINRHNMIRRTGKTFDRSPIYDATDYHYIRFTVRANVTMSYILYNDNLISCDF